MSMTREEAVPHYLSWREAREAQKAGKAIQFYNLFGDLRMWQDNTTECAIGDWSRDKDRVYRLKPGQAPTPRPVPPGCVSLEEAKAAQLRGESVELNWSGYNGRSGGWLKAPSMGWSKWWDTGSALEFDYRIVKPTPRPVPPGTLAWEEARDAQAAGKVVQWFAPISKEWRDETEIPESGMSYRLKPVPKLVPLGPEDVLSTTEFRDPNMPDRRLAWWWVDQEGVRMAGRTESWQSLMAMERTDDAGKTWHPCSKEAS